MLQRGKPGIRPGLPIEAERRANIMVLVLVKLSLRLLGKLTVLIRIPRKRKR
jgi:hypothetical protein